MTKYKEQRINGWCLGMAIFFWCYHIPYSFQSNLNNWEIFLSILSSFLAVLFTMLSFEDIE